MRESSGEVSHLTPTLSFQEREPVAVLATTRDGPRELGSAWTGYGEDAVRQPLAGTLIAGIGFRAGTEPDEIVTLLRQALTTLPPPAVLGAIATAADRADEAPIRLAADTFGLVPIPVEPAALAAIDARVPTRSARIEASRGIGSVAEAAALAAAGEGGRLVLSRIASAGATCALAVAAEEPSP